ncbi:MAG: type II toxin-antitoxin system HicB family antitoxin [Clostridiales Family XIII bacterium]|jgi:predicted RNase H-like HicB family nuclease|nr:type II toxin-antitoxin system HicB family antitoxin [Clostridiales Family XIII bacterium]
MSKQVYPIVLKKGKQKAYIVYVPDFDIGTQGNDLADAIEMAQDAIEATGLCIQDAKEPMPAPSNIDSVKVEKGEIKTLVTVDFNAYRRKTETRIVKKNLSLPSWLNVEAEAAGVNFSAVLQEALKERLHPQG